MTLTLCYHCIYHTHVRGVLLTCFPASEGVSGLRKWCEENTGETISDFDESWRDGMYYARIIAKHRPALVNMKALEAMKLDKRLDSLFTVFEEKLDLFVLIYKHCRVGLFIVFLIQQSSNFG